MDIPVPPAKMARLLVCTDGSPAGEGALAAALALARLLGSKLDLLQVIEVPLGYAGLTSEAVLKRWEREVRDYLEGVRIKAEPLGVRVEPRVGFGDAAFAVIVDEAKKLKPDLLLIGRKGKTRLAQLLMGSTTARVIGLSPVDVLVVPKDATLGLSRLLVASDGSPFGDAAFTKALALAKRLESALFGLSVAREEGELQAAQAATQQMLSQANRQGVPMEVRVRVGAPDDAIVQTALDTQAELIILGTHGRTGLTRLLMGSTTERVIGRSPIPVLVVKRGED